MTDLKKMSLKEMEEKGLIDQQLPIDPTRIKSMSNATIIGALPVKMKTLIAGAIGLLMFGIINVPIYVWYFFFK